MGFKNELKNAGEGLNWLMVIGFLGIVWLMIYGNLNGNLGFKQDSASYTGQAITLIDGAGEAPAGTTGKVNTALSNVIIINATGGETLTAANYTTSGSYIIASATSSYNNTDVNVSYTVTYDSTGKVDTDTVINNLTAGTKTFYSYSGTIFTVMAIVLLITILLSLLYVVMKIVNMGKNKGGFASE